MSRKGFETPMNRNYYFSKYFVPILRLPLLNFATVFSFGLLGAILCLRFWRKVLLLYFLSFAYMVATVPFIICARRCLPIVPFLIIFGAFAIWWFIQKVKERDYRRIALSLIPLVAFGIITTSNYPNPLRAEDHLILGRNYIKRGMEDEAIEEFKKTIKMYPYEEAGLLQLRCPLWKKGDAG